MNSIIYEGSIDRIEGRNKKPYDNSRRLQCPTLEDLDNTTDQLDLADI